MANYKNGREILPADLLAEVQKFVQGELIYIPKKESNRAGWGELNGARNYLRQRNREICNLFQKGWSIEKLIKRFHLSEDSVKKIISTYKYK